MIILTFLSFLSLFCFALSSPTLAALPRYDPTGTDIVCNPRQGLRRLYGLGGLLRSTDKKDLSCSGEVFVLWSQIEPQEGVYNWTALDEKLNEAVAKNKETTLSLGVSGNGLPSLGYPVETPAWVFQAMQNEANNCCGGITKLGTRSTPVPWNTVFQSKLRNILRAMRNHLKENPAYDRLVSAIIMYCGGPWGEMNLCSGGKLGCNRYGSWEEWTKAGYTHQKFSQAVLDLIDIYMDVFPDKPCALQLGNGMWWGDPNRPSDNSQQPSVVVKKEAIKKYGTRIILKFNGFGVSGTTPDADLCKNYYCSAESAHRYPDDWCWHEGGSRVCKPSTEDEYFDHFLGRALTEGLQWYGPNYVSQGEESKEESKSEFLSNPQTFTYFARHAGAQIMNLKTTFPENIQTGKEVNFTFKWFNRGNLPLFKTKLQGKKGVPVSYKIFVDLVNLQGQTIYHTTFTPNPPTTEWKLPDTYCLTHPNVCNPNNPENTPEWIKQKGNIVHTVNQQIFFPATIPSGNYKVFIGLSDPDDDNQRWNLVNTPGNDGSGRYEVGTIHCSSSSVFSLRDILLSYGLDVPSVDLNNDGLINSIDFAFKK